MRRVVIQMKPFSLLLDDLIKKHKLTNEIFNEFEKQLVENPEIGDPITGTGGIRKARMGSVGKGKRGSFRVIYLDIPKYAKTYLIALYGKNVKEDLSQDEKKELKYLVEVLTKEAKSG